MKAFTEHMVPPALRKGEGLKMNANLLTSIIHNLKNGCVPAVLVRIAAILCFRVIAMCGMNCQADFRRERRQ